MKAYSYYSSSQDLHEYEANMGYRGRLLPLKQTNKNPHIHTHNQKNNRKTTKVSSVTTDHHQQEREAKQQDNLLYFLFINKQKFLPTLRLREQWRGRNIKN